MTRRKASLVTWLPFIGNIMLQNDRDKYVKHVHVRWLRDKWWVFGDVIDMYELSMSPNSSMKWLWRRFSLYISYGTFKWCCEETRRNLWFKIARYRVPSHSEGFFTILVFKLLFPRLFVNGTQRKLYRWHLLFCFSVRLSLQSRCSVTVRRS